MLILTRYSNPLALLRPTGNEDCTVSLPLDIFQSEIHIYRCVIAYFYPPLFNIPDLLLDGDLGQTEFGNSNHQHPSSNRKRLENRYRIPHAGQVKGTGEPGRACTDDGHLLTFGLRKRVGRFFCYFKIPVCREPLQRTYCHRFIELTPATLDLTWMMANAPANGRKRISFSDNFCSLHIIAFGDCSYIAGNSCAHGTGVVAC